MGRYELTGRLGSGGQGAVYLGLAPDGRHVAVKLLHADQAGDDLARERFVREARVAMRVARFCTAQVLDADVDGDQPYLVSEYVPGPSLSRLVAERGPVTGAALDRLAIGTVTALAAIHQASIVHRDLKPGNVLIGPDGPRVIDFGIAKDGLSDTISGRIAGTPSYMAPEQFQGPPFTPAMDVFSWGATMVYAATGQSPFGQDTIPQVISRILGAEPDLGDLPDPMRSLVADCLAKDPALRPTARQILLRLLGQETAPASSASSASSPAAPVEEGMLARAATIAASGVAGAAGIAGAAAVHESLPSTGTGNPPLPSEGMPQGTPLGTGTEALPSVGAAAGTLPFTDAPTGPVPPGAGTALTDPVLLPSGTPAGRPARTARGSGARRAIAACTGALVAAMAIGVLVLSALDDNDKPVKPVSGTSSASTPTGQTGPGTVTGEYTGGEDPQGETGPAHPATTSPSTQPTETPSTGTTTHPHNPHETPYGSTSPSAKPPTYPTPTPSHPSPEPSHPDSGSEETGDDDGAAPAEDGEAAPIEP
ncbi:serine/threonine-protein kinase [Thermomonospora echinospora]|uniref:serine/threonine-protein kinase n=1 Tax=Thermomonospora echinospora TaxID=1992 RepID=UPI002E15056A